MTNVLIPCSIGEIADKITILQIKKERMSGDKVNDVVAEHDMLVRCAGDLVDIGSLSFVHLKKINEMIWDLMNVIRELSHEDESYSIVTRKTVLLNDARCRIKRVMNERSLLKEHKSYDFTCVLLMNANDTIKTFCGYLFDFVHDDRVPGVCYDAVIDGENIGDSVYETILSEMIR
jgi:hypothetical protein